MFIEWLKKFCCEWYLNLPFKFNLSIELFSPYFIYYGVLLDLGHKGSIMINLWPISIMIYRG